MKRPAPLGRVLMTLITVYRTAVSPLRPPSCRYLPTCSEYALEAISTHGSVRGGWLAVRRLLRCHPFHRGGHDPVPPLVGRRDPAHRQPASAGRPATASR